MLGSFTPYAWDFAKPIKSQRPAPTAAGRSAAVANTYGTSGGSDQKSDRKTTGNGKLAEKTPLLGVVSGDDPIEEEDAKPKPLRHGISTSLTHSFCDMYLTRSDNVQMFTKTIQTEQTSALV